MVPLNYELDACRFVARLEQGVEAQGIKLRCSRDFEEFQDTRDRVRSEMQAELPYRRLFHLSCVDLTPENAFWISGHDDSGQVVHLQAVRRDDLGGLTLAQYWERHYHRIFCLPSDGKLVRARAPVAQEICGSVCYHGEVWIAKSARKLGLGGKLGQLALGLALVSWKPDFIYGLVEPHIALGGFHLAEGYMHQFPNVIEWNPVPFGVNERDWLVWMTLEDLVELTQQPQGGRG